MLYKKHLQKTALLFLLFFFLSLSAFAQDKEQGNVLYKVELENTAGKTLIVKLYTAKKYTSALSPIKKEGLGYLLLLPKTRESLVKPASADRLNGLVSGIDVDYFPLASPNIGYTKVFIKTTADGFGLAVENEVYTPVKPYSESKNVETAEKQGLQKKPAGADKEKIPEEDKDKASGLKNRQKPEPLTSAKEKTVEEAAVKNELKTGYIQAFIILFLLASLITDYLFIRSKNNLKSDGDLLIRLKKLAKKFSGKNGLLLFSNSESLISNVCEFCVNKGINLHIATKNPREMQEKISPSKNINLSLSEFKFDEFYKHRDFYKKLNPKPAGFIFDIEPDFLENLPEKKFDFILFRKLIDKNYTNFFLILNLIFNDIKNKNGFVIFATNKKISGSGKKTFSGKAFYSTQKAMMGFVEEFKADPENREKIFYCTRKVTD